MTEEDNSPFLTDLLEEADRNLRAAHTNHCLRSRDIVFLDTNCRVVDTHHWVRFAMDSVVADTRSSQMDSVVADSFDTVADIAVDIAD